MRNIIGELVWKITGDNTSANKALKETDKQATKTSKSFSKLKVGVVAAGVAIAGAAVALTRMVRNQLNVIDASAKMADKLGVSMEAMIGLEHIAGLTGASAEQLGVAVQMLDVRIGQSAEGVGKAESSLRQLGLSMEDVTSLEPDKAFFKVAESLQKVEDRTQQAYLAQELFGRQGRELLGVIRSSGSSLGDLADEAERLGLTISRSAAAEVERFNDNMFRVSQRSKGFGRQLINELVPSLNNLAEAFLESSKDGGVLMKLFNQITEVIGNVINAMAILTARLDQASLEKDFKNAAKEAEKFLDTQRRLRQEIINRYGGMKQIEELSKQDSLRGKEALMLLQSYNKAARDTTKAIHETQNANDRYKNGLAFMEGIQRRIEGVEGDINQRLNERITIANTLKNVIGEAGKQTVKTFEDMALEFNNYTQAIGNGLNNLMSAFQAYNSAVYQSKIDRLDAELEAELEAAGVSEETTVEQAQREYDIAQATGTELEKEEKRRALVKAKIEEKYQKKKAQLEYEAALTSWQFQRAIAALQIPLAIMNAVASGAQAPWFLQPGFMIAMGSIAGITAGAQFAAVEASKPQPPKFAEGGIVPGTSFSGDRVQAQVNSGEMILNQSQQARLFEIANQGGGSGNITVYLGDELIYKSLYNASKRGDLIIDARGVVTR